MKFEIQASLERVDQMRKGRVASGAHGRFQAIKQLLSC